MTKVIHVYRDMLRQAEIFRQKAFKLKDNEEEQGNYNFYSQIQAELYHWVAELEKTEEINPPIAKATPQEVA